MPSQRLRRKLTKENLWLYVLSLLKDRDMYGYELRGSVEERFGFRPGNVTAYRVLYALRRQGLVRTAEKKTGGRKRKYYSITPKGASEMESGKRVLREVLNGL